MAWTTPKTDWETGELVAASDLNAIGENLALLGNLASATYTTPQNISIGNSPFVDVDSNNLSLTITTTGRDVLVHFDGVLNRTTNNHTIVWFDIAVDGNRQSGDDGLVHFTSTTNDLSSFTRLIQNLSAGSHTFNLQWKVHRGVRLQAGANFWVREI